MMDAFEPHYDVEMKELIFTGYKNNKFIYGQMVYVIDNDYRYNIIWGRDFNTWRIMIKSNKLYMGAEINMIELIMIYVMVYTPRK